MTKLQAAVLCLVLAGCGSAAGPGSTGTSRAADLFAARTAYLGDASRVIALVHQVAPASVGDLTMELQTAHAPLGLTVHVQRLTKPFAATDFDQAATLLLGLIANVDEVTFDAGRETHTFTSASATKAAGFDVKQLGKDQKVLTDYLSKTAR